MRITYSRDGKHASADPLKVLTVGAGVLLAAPIAFAVLYFLTGVRGAFLPGLLVVTSAALVTVRGIVLLADRTIRRWIFDREQRSHEIVPRYLFTEEETPQDA